MKGSSVLKGFLVVVALIFVINQVVSSVYSPVKTDSAVFYTSTDGFNITGIIIRNETLVNYDGDGVMHFVISDGNRVAKNGVIANVYNNENASITASQTELIRKRIKDIEDILSYNDVEAVNLDLINARIEERVNDLIITAGTGDYYNIQECAQELLSAFNRRQAALGDTENFSAELQSLTAQLSTSLPSPEKQIFSEQSGYFVSKTDGYEQVLTTTDLTAITPEFLSSAKAVEYSDAVVGKIVSDYEWYIAAEVSINESMNFKEGEGLKLTTSVTTSPELSVTVKKINISETSSNAVLIFACNEMNSELASMRSGPMTVVKAEYSGLKIPKRALRVVDSVRGVYVLNGMQISFVPIEILYSNDSYIICEKQTENGNVLKLYDRVVVKGRNLYDGKIVS
ncbi:MAG: hypothetical protein IKD04_08730 [Clostridia bacterium]|nr:hypothetical protein [Clostridia bacterium]